MEWHPQIDPVTRARAVDAAQGKAPFDLLLCGGTIVDVVTGELRNADIGIVGPMIASVHAPGTRSDTPAVYSVTGKFLTPGLIDAHVHFESSHMLPHHYASTVVPQGTTTIFYDPHELANVLGLRGVRYAIEASRNLPLRFLCQAPSSVPSAPGLETSGGAFGRAEMREMLSWPEVLGVAEMMDMNGVLHNSSRMAGIAEEGRAANKLVEGHARGLSGPKLQGYLSAGITSDHEITSGDDFLEKLRAGLAIELRGSHDYVIPAVAKVLAELPHLSSQIMLCTDDVPPDLLLEKGGLADVLRRFIARGLKPTDAIRFATFNTALRLGRPDLGALCAGRIADIVVLSDLETILVEDVFVSGRHIGQRGRMLHAIQPAPVEHPRVTMHVPRMAADDFRIRVDLPDGIATIRTIRGVRFSEWCEVEVQVRDGLVIVPPDANLICVQHRHGKYRSRPQLALQTGIPQLKGAIASTYLHDSHNLFVIGSTAEAMTIAANAVIDCGGGTAVAQSGKLLAMIGYPIAGILSEEEPAEVARQFAAVRDAAGTVAEWKPPYWVFKAIEGMSLVCNPFPYLTDLGLVDGDRGECVEMLVQHRDAQTR
jgi:adenine deaminase